MAGRMYQRDYRTRANSPSGTIADSDVFTHDAARRMLTAVSGRYNNTVEQFYDLAGRLESESLTISGQTYTVSREYDLRGLLSKYTYPDGSTVERTYTDRRQLHEVKYNSNIVDTRSYDVGGRLASSTCGNAVVTDFDHFADNRIKAIDTTHPQGVTITIGTYSYTWDANKNKTSESVTGVLSGYSFNSGANPAAYDDEDRLTEWNRADSNKDQTWTLSLVGNWDSFTENTTTETRRIFIGMWLITF